VPRTLPSDTVTAAAVAALPARSCLIDGEAIVTDQNGLAVFDLIRGHRPNQRHSFAPFDLIELDGEDLRREPIETRKSTLKSLLRGKHEGIAFNAIVYRQACALGCEGIVSKRLGSPYRSGRADSWVKVKEPGGARGHARGRGGLELASFGRNRERYCRGSFIIGGRLGPPHASPSPASRFPRQGSGSHQSERHSSRGQARRSCLSLMLLDQYWVQGIGPPSMLLARRLSVLRFVGRDCRVCRE
jgi:ATP dependent DNA ligase domain